MIECCEALGSWAGDIPACLLLGVYGLKALVLVLAIVCGERKLDIVKGGGKTGEVDRGGVGRTGIGSCPIVEDGIGEYCALDVEGVLAAPEFSTGPRDDTCC